jgi:hypothetical protein
LTSRSSRAQTHHAHHQLGQQVPFLQRRQPDHHHDAEADSATIPASPARNASGNEEIMSTQSGT